MKKIFKLTSIIILTTTPLLSFAQSTGQINTKESFLASKKQDSEKALSVIPDKENIKIFKDLFNYGADKLQSRLDNILKDKKNYPEVASEVNTFKTDIKSNLAKFKSTDQKLSKAKQLGVKNNLNLGLFKTLDKKITKLESADTKITEKISLLVASNIDISNSTNLLSAAEQKLAIAKSSVSNVKSQINNAISSVDGISVDEIRASVLEANDKIMDAVNAYKATLDSLPTTTTNENTASNSPQTDDVATSTLNDQTTGTSTDAESISTSTQTTITLQNSSEQSESTTTQTTFVSQNLNGQAEIDQNNKDQSNTDIVASSSESQN